MKVFQDKNFVKLFLFDIEKAFEHLKKECVKENSDFESKKTQLLIISEEFEKQKKILISFVKEIQLEKRQDQAKSIKKHYGTKNIKSRICFRLIDAQSADFTDEENVDLFVFVSKFVDIK